MHLLHMSGTKPTGDLPLVRGIRHSDYRRNNLPETPAPCIYPFFLRTIRPALIQVPDLNAVQLVKLLKRNTAARNEETHLIRLFNGNQPL